jgi:hypothetical protein
MIHKGAEARGKTQGKKAIGEKEAKKRRKWILMGL